MEFSANYDDFIHSYNVSDLIIPINPNPQVEKGTKIIIQLDDYATKTLTDYFKVLDNICRVTNKYIVLTLGNRTVDRVKIDLNDITKKVYIEQRLRTYKNL